MTISAHVFLKNNPVALGVFIFNQLPVKGDFVHINSNQYHVISRTLPSLKEDGSLDGFNSLVVKILPWDSYIKKSNKKLK